MGLFAHHSSSSRRVKSSDKLYVFVRSSNVSATAAASWSLATSEKPQRRANSFDGHERQKQRRSILSFRSSRESNTNTKSRSNSIDESTPADDIYEFSMTSGQFKKTNLTQAEDFVVRSDATSNAATSPAAPDASLLLRIEIPHSFYSDSKRLSNEIEKTLNRHASAPPSSDKQDNNDVNTTDTSADIDTETRLKFVLLTLQSESLLPPPSFFDADKFIHYAQANLAQYRNELDRPASTSTTNHEPNASTTTTTASTTYQSSRTFPGTTHTKEISYTAHLSANDRLRAHFGHSSSAPSSVTKSPSSSTTFSSPSFFPSNFALRNQNGYDVYGDKIEYGHDDEEDEDEGYGDGAGIDENEYRKRGRFANGEEIPHIYGGFGGGGFWVTRPQLYGAGGGGGGGNGNGSGSERKERNVYGGLM